MFETKKQRLEASPEIKTHLVNEVFRRLFMLIKLSTKSKHHTVTQDRESNTTQQRHTNQFLKVMVLPARKNKHFHHRYKIKPIT